VKLADVEPAPTETVCGTVSGPALLERFTVAPPAGAAFDNVTEQAEVPPGPRLAGVHETCVTTVAATREMDVLAELPLYDAVIVAD
jgi:hypothetical protein